MLPQYMEEKYLASPEQIAGWHEDEHGYFESYPLPKTQNGIALFHAFESYQISSQDIEIRPPWFHINRLYLKITGNLPVFTL